MIIEDNIFKRAEINKNLLEQYGFRQSKDFWTLEVLFMNGDIMEALEKQMTMAMQGCII